MEIDDVAIMATFYIYCFHAIFFTETEPSSHNRNLYDDDIYDNIEPNYYYDSENYVWYPLDIDDPEL